MKYRKLKANHCKNLKWWSNTCVDKKTDVSTKGDVMYMYLHFYFVKCKVSLWIVRQRAAENWEPLKIFSRFLFWSEPAGHRIDFTMGEPPSKVTATTKWWTGQQCLHLLLKEKGKVFICASVYLGLMKNSTKWAFLNKC